MITGYPKINQIYSKEAEDFFRDRCFYIEEKIDGSQISFKLGSDGKLYVKSKSVMLEYVAPTCLTNSNFTLACQQIDSIKHLLVPDWTYRGEYLKSPRHNKLHYGRVPEKNIVLYDIQKEDGSFLLPHLMELHAKEIGLESTPIIFEENDPRDMIDSLLKRESFLGNAIVEGVVIKHYDDNLNLSSIKVVREDFKEVRHVKEKIVKDFDIAVTQLADTYVTHARYEKAVQYLNDSSEPLLSDMRDVPKIIERVSRDVLEEEEENIKSSLHAIFEHDDRFKDYESPKNAMFKTYWGSIQKQVTRGIGSWYKNKLIERMK